MPPFTMTPLDLVGNALTLNDFGDPGEGDNYAIFQAAASSGKAVTVPGRSTPYLISSALVFSSGTQLIGLDWPEIKIADGGAGLMLNLNGLSDVQIRGLVINGNKANTSSVAAISMASSVDCVLSDLELLNLSGTGVGSIVLSGTSTGNLLEKLRSAGSESTCIGLSGTGVSLNTVRLCELQTNGAFGVRLGEGAHHNNILFNRSTDSALEAIGITSDCHGNRVIGNHCEGSGDNGISISGYNNICIGNHCLLNDRAGIWAWGSHNTIIGNHCLNNVQDPASQASYAGIGTSANYGGTGQFNTIIGNVIDDDQVSPTQRGVRMGGLGYTLWAQGQTIAVSDYRYYGLNIYIATTAGTTGATPPTHTTGTASDGTVTWRYVRSFLNTAANAYNTVANNTLNRYLTASYFDAGNWILNYLDETTGSTGVHSIRGTQIDFYANAVQHISITSGYTRFFRGTVQKLVLTAADYQVLVTDYMVEVTSTAAARTITLPASGRVAGMTFRFKDSSGGAGTNNITIARSGANIDGVAADLVINTNYGKAGLYWSGSQWLTI